MRDGGGVESSLRHAGLVQYGITASGEPALATWWHTCQLKIVD